MTDAECDCWEIVKISRGLADAPASRVYVEIPWLQEAVHNIQQAIARAERERRDAA